MLIRLKYVIRFPVNRKLLVKFGISDVHRVPQASVTCFDKHVPIVLVRHLAGVVNRSVV